MNQRRSASHRLRRATRLVMPPISPIVRPLPPAGRLEAADGFRTRDLELGKLALYQLSYRRSAAHSRSRPPGPADDEWPLRCHAMKGPETSKIKAVIAH